MFNIPALDTVGFNKQRTGIQMENNHPFPDRLSTQPSCEVCGCLIRFHHALQDDGLGYTVCHAFDCRRIMSQKASMSPAMFAMVSQLTLLITPARPDTSMTWLWASKESQPAR